MATSLLYLLLGVKDSTEIEVLKKQDSNHLAVKLDGLGPKEMREVRGVLYKALYAVLASADIYMPLSSAMGKALCIGIEGAPDDPEIQALKNALQPVVTEVIREI